MKTIFDQKTALELENRIKRLTETDEAQWGKMNVSEMVQHCLMVDDLYLGIIKPPRVFISYLIGGWILKKYTKDDSLLQKGWPTLPQSTVFNSIDFETEKGNWIKKLQSFKNFPPSGHIIHPFFGKINYEQLGILAYKHYDHHLRQFGR